MSKRYDRFRAMFYVLETHQHRQEPVTLKHLAQATGYKLSSMRTYHAKYLKGRVLFGRADGEGYDVRGLEEHDSESFIALMTATTREAPPVAREVTAVAPEVRCDPAVARELLRQALCLYHADTTGWCQAMFVRGLEEAWVGLLRAEPGAETGAEREVLIERLDAPVRRNLEWIQSLTREWADALLPETQGPLTRLYQASVLNFRRRFEVLVKEPLFVRGEGLLVLGGKEEVVWEARACEERHGAVARERAEDMLQALTVDEVTLHAAAFVTPGRYRVELDTVAPQRARRMVSTELRSRIFTLDGDQAVYAINARLPYERRLTQSVLPLLDRHMLGDPEVTQPLSWLDDRTGQMRYASAYVDWVVTALEADEAFLERLERVYARMRS